MRSPLSNTSYEFYSSSHSLPHGKTGWVYPTKLVFTLFLALGCFSWMGEGVVTKVPQRLCVSEKSLELNDAVNRYILDNRRQVTLPLTLGASDRISHRLTNAIFTKFIQQVVGYHDVKVVPYNDTMSTQSLMRYYNETSNNPHKNQVPPDLVNLEVWIPPGFLQNSANVVDRGSQGTGGRFGWYVSKGNFSDTELFLYHWRSYRKTEVITNFKLTPEQLNQVKTIFTKDYHGNHYCPDDVCVDGIFVPDLCQTEPCATLFAGYYEYSSFLIEQVVRQKLLVQVAWIGPYLTPRLIMKFRENLPLLFFSWWPSPLTVLDGLIPVSFPPCIHITVKDNYLCRYEMYTLRKLAWFNLKEYGYLVYETVERFSFQENDYRDLLVEYNQRTMAEDSNSLFQPIRQPGWDDHIIDEIACNWLKRTSDLTLSGSRKVHMWRPNYYNMKPELWFAGIFPMGQSSSRYTSKHLLFAAQMAIGDINKNSSILNDYSLTIKTENGDCSVDGVLYSFIRFLLTKDLQINRLIGILGPSCSDTIQPLAGLARMLNTVIISYSAEGTLTNDQETYPYFFRTIPENHMYQYVYLHLLRELKWKRLASFTEYGNKYSEYLTLLEDKLTANNISIFNKKFSREARKDMREYLKSMKNDHYYIIIGEFYPGTACEIMCEAFQLEMTARQGFVWFLPRWFLSEWWLNCNKDRNEDRKPDLKCDSKQMLQAIDGHLSLGSSFYANDKYVYHSGDTVADWRRRHIKSYGVTPPDYAGYTYDAVWTYAFALDKLLKENFTHAANLHSNVTTERLVQLLRDTNFNGVSGHIDFPRGTSSRQTIVNIMQFRSDIKAETGTYHTVGSFNPNDRLPGGGTIRLNSSAIEWLTPNREQPGDGSRNKDYCALEPFNQLLGVGCDLTIVIVMLFCFVIFACCLVGCFFVYKIRYEKIAYPPCQLRALMTLVDESEIARDRVVINRPIGFGAFGTVYGGMCFINQESGWAGVAVKTLKKGSTTENKLDFLSEAEMMKRFDHKNIVKFIGLCTQSEPMYMIMEYVLYGDLRTYLLARRHLVSERTFYNDDDEISNRRLTSMAVDVANALEYLSINQYVHRDVASRNCLVNADKIVKLSDFGMTRPVNDKNYYKFIRKGMLPVRWMAPESLEDGINTTKTDVWSYGVLLYEIITFGNFPFQGLSNSEVLEQVVNYHRTLETPKEIHPLLDQILHRCWARCPEHRPTFPEMIEIFTQNTRLITPCLEVPIASVQTNDSNSLNIGIDSTRKFSMGKTLIRPNPTPPQNLPQQEDITYSSPVQRRDSETPSFSDIMQLPSFNPDLLSSVTPPSNGTWTKRHRTPVENGNGPTVEPLLPMTEIRSPRIMCATK